MDGRIVPGIDPSMTPTYDGLTFDRPGHSTVRIETDDGLVCYIDPWSEILDRSPTDADVVFVSHDDRDHYDPAGIDMVATDGAIVVAFDAIDTAALDHEVVSLPANGTRTVAGIHVRAVPAYNRPDGPHVRPSGEPYHPEGTVIGFVISFDETTVYYCSDTDPLEELATVEADVVIPPIGGRPTMDRHEAAALIERIDPDLVLPVHYNSDLVEDIETDAEAFKADLEALGIRVELF